MAVVAGLPAALGKAREAGFWVVGLAVDAEQSLFDLGLAAEPVMLVLGAEGGGLSRLVEQRCDVTVRIPMAPGVSSLNVAAAGALALFEIRRRRAGTH
jgi:23S rRNA (guanosine2251-2'-O)-methyltransferase